MGLSVGLEILDTRGRGMWLVRISMRLVWLVYVIDGKGFERCLAFGVCLEAM